MISAVLFDFDNVIFDMASVDQQSYFEVAFNWKLKNYEEVYDESLYATPDRKAEVYQESYGKEFDYYSFVNEVLMLKDAKLAQFELELRAGTEQVIEDMFEDYKLGVISSQPVDTVHKLLAKHQLTDYFEFVIASTDFLDTVSARDYKHICDTHAIAPEDCVAVESSVIRAKSAYNAGLKPILVSSTKPDNFKLSSINCKRCENLFQAQVEILSMK